MIIKVENLDEVCFYEIPERGLFRAFSNPSDIYYKIRLLGTENTVCNAVNLNTGELVFFNRLDSVYKADGYLTVKN